MFRKVYNTDLQDLEQPLLVHRPKDKEIQRVSPNIIGFFFFKIQMPTYHTKHQTKASLLIAVCSTLVVTDSKHLNLLDQ